MEDAQGHAGGRDERARREALPRPEAREEVLGEGGGMVAGLSSLVAGDAVREGRVPLPFVADRRHRHGPG
jgi:hypothetical protein